MPESQRTVEELKAEYRRIARQLGNELMPEHDAIPLRKLLARLDAEITEAQKLQKV